MNQSQWNGNRIWRILINQTTVFMFYVSTKMLLIFENKNPKVIFEIFIDVRKYYAPLANQPATR